MPHTTEVKDRFRTRLAAADARSNGFRQKLLDDGTRALQPVIEVLNLMAEVLNEEHNAHGCITGTELLIDTDNFVTLCAKLRGVDSEQKIKIKYGPSSAARTIFRFPACTSATTSASCRVRAPARISAG